MRPEGTGEHAGSSPPLSVTVSKHRLAHHSGLGLQLLHLLQQCLFAGVLSPRARGTDREKTVSGSDTVVKTGNHSPTCPLDELNMSQEVHLPSPKAS